MLGMVGRNLHVLVGPSAEAGFPLKEGFHQVRQQVGVAVPVPVDDCNEDDQRGSDLQGIKRAFSSEGNCPASSSREIAQGNNCLLSEGLRAGIWSIVRDRGNFPGWKKSGRSPKNLPRLVKDRLSICFFCSK